MEKMNSARLVQCAAAAGAAFLAWKFLRSQTRRNFQRGWIHVQGGQQQKPRLETEAQNLTAEVPTANPSIENTRSAGGVEDEPGREPLCSLLTVVITTSPGADNPRTFLQDQVVESFGLVDGLLSCRIIIVCDGYKYVEGISPSKINLRGGKVDDIRMQNYEGYKSALRAKASSGEGCWKCVEVLELAEHQGFGFAVKEGLRHVTTEFVCVVQHDRKFMRPLDFHHVLAGFATHRDLVGYVLIPTTSTRNYAHAQKSRLGQLGWKDCNLDASALDLGKGVKLLPCLQFYDSTHICRTEYYKNWVFGFDGGGDLGGRGVLFKRGGYIEEIFNQEQRRMWMEEGGGGAGKPGGRVVKGEKDQTAAQMRRFVSEFKTWLYEDGEGRAVGHLNGRTYRHALQGAQGKRGG